MFLTNSTHTADSPFCGILHIPHTIVNVYISNVNIHHNNLISQDS